MIKKLIKSSEVSIQGLITASNIDKSIKLELYLTLPIIIIIFLLFNKTDAQILISLWFLILIVELINTAIEKSIDLISIEENIIIKKIKDISSAAVFLSILVFVINLIFILFKKIT